MRLIGEHNQKSRNFGSFVKFSLKLDHVPLFQHKTDVLFEINQVQQGITCIRYLYCAKYKTTPVFEHARGALRIRFNYLMYFVL